MLAIVMAEVGSLVEFAIGTLNRLDFDQSIAYSARNWRTFVVDFSIDRKREMACSLYKDCS